MIIQEAQLQKVTRTNYRVEITPSDRDWLKEQLSEKVLVETCEDIKRQVLRHIDLLQSGSSVRITYDVEKTCEYCGYPWGEKSTTYNGGCCRRDEESNPDPQSEKTKVP